VNDKGRIGELEEIAKEFERLMAREERRLSVELTTARELSDDEARDHRADRAGGWTKGRGDAHGRSGPRRRHRAAGGVVSGRRERAGTIGTTATDTREELRDT